MIFNKLAASTALIVLAANPSRWVGADNSDGSAVKQVITDGTMKTWSAKNGCYVLDDIWYAGINGQDVVVSLDAPDCGKFHVVLVGPDVYRIEVRGTNLAWTTGLDPKKPVIITPVGSVAPEYQEFKFQFEV